MRAHRFFLISLAVTDNLKALKLIPKLTPEIMAEIEKILDNTVSRLNETTVRGKTRLTLSIFPLFFPSAREAQHLGKIDSRRSF